MSRMKRAAHRAVPVMPALCSPSSLAFTFSSPLGRVAYFYAYRNNNATILDMCAFAEMTERGLKGEFDF